MAARQRFRAVLDARRASQPCWRCALNLPRYNSTSPAGTPDSSKSADGDPYGLILQEKRRIEKEPALEIMGESNIASMQAAHEPRTRVETGDRPVALQDFVPLRKVRARHLTPREFLTISKYKVDAMSPPVVKWLKTPFLIDTPIPGPLETVVGMELPTEKLQVDSVDAEAMSPTPRKVKERKGRKGRRTSREPSKKSRMDKDVCRPVERNSQNPENSKGNIDRFKDFMAEKFGARVRLLEDSVIRKILVDKSALIKKRLLNKSARKIRDTLIKKYLVGKSGPNIRDSAPRFPRDSTQIVGPSILSVAERDNATPLVCKVGPPLGQGPTDMSEVASKGQCEDKAFHDTLTSLLDEFKDLPTSTVPAPTTEIGKSILSTRFSPLDRSIRRPALKSSGTSRHQAWNRHYATAISQTLQADAQIDPAIIGANPDGLLKKPSGSIREALRLWQEQHEIALAGTSGRPPSSMLSDTQNLVTQSGEDEGFTTISLDEKVEDDDDVDIRSDEPIPDIFAHQVFLRRGDLVELRASSESILAIFVRNVADQCQFYTIRGEWVHREPGGARWAVSRFVDPDDLNEILPYLPAEEVVEEKLNLLQPIDLHAPRGAGAKVIEQMLLFHQTTDAVFRKHADRINRLYEIIAPSEAFADRTYMSLRDIAMDVLAEEDPSKLTQPMLWAIHKAISQCQNIMWDQMNYRQNPIYEIYPQRGLKYISQVREWVREYQEVIIQGTTNESKLSLESTLMESTQSLNPIVTFVKKARFAIKENRQKRPLSKSGLIGPSLTRIDIDENLGKPCRETYLQNFDANERTIIHYLDVWATSSYVNPHTNLASLGPMILRAIGMYEDFALDASRGFTLLQELGVVTPWENRTVYKLRNLKLPGHDGGLGEASRLLRESHKEQLGLNAKDSMEGLRKDWGDMPVFCIDSAETLERDDGISLELVDNDESAYWVHVHVANPSAIITPDSAMAKYAASLGESVYFPEKKYAMLSPMVTKDKLSLANDRPCITFSAKISADGDILEKKVTPGIVHNVHYLTPQMVSQGLGLTATDEAPETVSILTVGGCMPTKPIHDSDQTGNTLSDPGHIEVLHKLLDLGEAARHKRVQAGAPDFYSSARIAATHPIVYLSASTVEKSRIKDEQVRQIEGDPIITLQRTTESYGQVAKMVSDLMIIAGDVAASWCSERNIPIPYRGILRNPEPASSPDIFKREILDPKIAKYGHAEQTDLLRYMRLVGQAQASDRPLEHHTLGLPAYCKATSPLRRYIDMYTHWQIEAAIRHEAATGTSLVGSTDGSYLPFTRAQVEEYAGGALHRERKISQAKSSSTRHWICQALFRAFHFEEAQLPETFEVVTMHGWLKQGQFTGWLKGWNVKVLLQMNSTVVKEGGCRIGDVWEAKLTEVDTYHKKILMEPVRLIEKERGPREMG